MEKKPKEKKEKKPKEKKEKKKKDKSFKIPDIDGGLTIDGETPASQDVTVHADTEITVESVGISVPEVDVHTDVAIVETPTTDVEVRSKPVGTFDVNIGEQIDDLILTYQMDSKDETYSSLTGDVPCAVIELPEIPDTVLPMSVVHEDTVDVISEGVVEQGIDTSTYEDKFSVKPKLDIDVSLPPVQDENKFPQAIELPKPMENDMPFLVAIENDIDASDIIGESFLSPVENELTSFSLIPMPVENEFDGGLTIEGEIPVLEDVTVHADTEIPVESAGYSVPEADVHIEEHVIVVPDHKSDSSSSSSSDSDDDGVLPTEDGEKKKKVKKIKVKKEKKPKEKKEKKPKEKKEKKKKDKNFKIPDIDGGLTIDGESPVVDGVVVHADTDIPTESVEISLPEVHVHTEEHVIVVPEHKSDSSSSSSSDSDDD